MKVFEKLDKHSGLVSKMSSTVGADWTEKLAEDSSLASQYRNAVMTCTHCKHVGECQGWLNEHDTAPETPDYCLNKELLEKLARS